MKYVIVYQAGIANVFSVESTDSGKIRRRLMQHAFEPCEWFMRGLQYAGGDCYFACANYAGDIAGQDWDTPLSCAPFSDRMAIIFPHCSYAIGKAPKELV
jgi:hypothetical protein